MTDPNTNGLTEPVLPPLILTDNRQVGEVISGVLDVMLAFGCALAERGLLERHEIAAEMQKVVQQQLRQDGQPSPRQYAPDSLRRFFSAQVRPGGRGAAGLVPIEGGKNDPPPSAA